MHFSILAVTVAVAGIVSAQTQGTLPTCANNCVTQLLPTRCNSDPACICSDSNFIDNISCCVFNACPESDQQAALNFAKTYCTPVGVTLPQSAGCSAGATVSSATATAGATGSLSSALASANGASTTSSQTGSTSASAASATSSAGGQKLAAQGMGLVGAVVGAVALL